MPSYKRKRPSTTVYSSSSKKSRPSVLIRRPPLSLNYFGLPNKPELKEIQDDLSGNILTSISTTTLLVDLAAQVNTGVQIYERVGQKIAIKSFNIKGVLQNGHSSTYMSADAWNVLRFALIHTRTPIDPTEFTLNNPFDRVSNPKIIKKYFDKNVLLQPTPMYTGTAATYSSALTQFNKNITFKRPLIYSYQGSQGSSNTDHLYLCVVSDSTTVPHPGFIHGHIKLTFYDV